MTLRNSTSFSLPSWLDSGEGLVTEKPGKMVPRDNYMVTEVYFALHKFEFVK